MSKDLGTYRNGFPRLDAQLCNSEDELLVQVREDSKLESSWHISVSVLQGFEVFTLIHSSIFATDLPLFGDTV